MAELNIEYHPACPSIKAFQIDVKGSESKPYRVSFDRFNKGQYQYNWACTCKSFQYGGGKDCKHIEQAQKDSYCGWDGFWNAEKPIKILGKTCCPRCLKECITIKHGV